jgi:hypothetical protein
MNNEKRVLTCRHGSVHYDRQAKHCPLRGKLQWDCLVETENSIAASHGELLAADQSLKRSKPTIILLHSSGHLKMLHKLWLHKDTDEQVTLLPGNMYKEFHSNADWTSLFILLSSVYKKR